MLSTCSQSRQALEFKVDDGENVPEKPDVKTKSIAAASRSSSTSKIKKLEARKKALDEIAAAEIKILKEAALQKLRLEEEFIDKEESDLNSQASSSRVKEWVDTTVVQNAPIINDPVIKPQQPERTATIQNIKAHSCTSEPKIDQITKAIERGYHKVHHHSKLPVYDGNPTEWLIFKAAYYDTANDLTPADNMLRLRCSLKGDARKAVSSLFITNSDPEEIIAALEMRFGNQYNIVKEQLQVLNTLPLLSTTVQNIANFTSIVTNSINTIKALKRQEHLHNPELYNAVMKKLDNVTLSKWYEYADNVHEDSSPMILTLSNFLKKETEKYIRFAPYSAIDTASPQPTYRTSTTGSSEMGPSFPGHQHRLTSSTNTPTPARYPVNVTSEGPSKSVETYALLDEGATITLIDDELAKDIGAEGAGSQIHLQGLGLDSIEYSKKVQLTISGTHSQPHKIYANTKKSFVLGPQCINKAEFLKFSHLKAMEDLIDWESHCIPKVLIGQDNWPLIVTRELCAGRETEPVASKTALGWVLHGTINRLAVLNTTNDLTYVNYIYKVNDCKKLYQVKNFEKSICSINDSPESYITKNASNKTLDHENAIYKVLNTKSTCSSLSALENSMCHENGTEEQSKSNNVILSHKLNSTNNNTDDELLALVKKSFELDNLGIQSKQRTNTLEQRAIDILHSTTKRINDNTWETGLLWQSDNVIMPEESHSYNMALKRLQILERKLQKDPNLTKAYSDQIQKLFDKNYAVVCQSQSGLSLNSNISWFLPHFAVINPNKPGKVRPVFDAAAKTAGTCLNDKLLTGPDLLQSLLGMLLRFRHKRVGVSADIRDMFLRIKIREDDQEAQKFLWREPNDPTPPKVCKMTSMLFGATCSPCSAIYVKDKNAKQFESKYPESVKAIITNHYVDDYLDCFDSEDEAIQRTKEIIFIHSQGGFDIRSWASNAASVLEAIPEDRRAHEVIDLTPETGQINKTLGMVWETATDTLTFNMSMHRVPLKISTCQDCPTKRQMLSVIMSVFDPIGLVTPLTIKGKILLQDVWRTKVNWDDKIEQNQYEKLRRWIHDLNMVRQCKIPRCYAPRQNVQNIQLHTFCDASEKAYAAACFLRYQYKGGDVMATLVAAKAMVTPLKPMSIPRLELQAALLGARLAKTVVEELKIELHEKYFWSDSATTLAWIRSDPRKYKPYVGHRLAAIDELSSPPQWRWVPTAENPADIATRDIHSCNFSANDKWFIGPSFLYQLKTLWPTEKEVPRPTAEAVTEERVNTVVRKSDSSVPDITRFSSLLKLTKTMVLVLLFINKCRKIGAQTLNVDLLDKAEKILITKFQLDSFGKDIQQLKDNNKPLKDSTLLQVCPYLDSDGLLRARGRIDLAPKVLEACKRPIILDHSHPYTKLLIFQYHKEQNHASTETVLNEIKQKYYISRLRSTLRSITHHCQICKLRRATPSVPIMGDLPLCRLDHHKRPFTHCGLDYFGPMEVSIGRRREKRYGALFTCMVSRAVHIEIAHSLTSDAVIMAIRRMVGRRGCPTDIYSDNGTNFKGADTELKKSWQELIKDECIQKEMLNKKIKWHFIPATAANMGGAWERLVQSIKKALYATLKEKAPREETLATLLVEAEHTVNSRPLTHVSDDVNDPEALTPNHFLIGASSGVSLPGKFDDKDLMLRKQWKIAQRLADMFWQRWLKEYLPILLPRTGSDCDIDKDLKLGDLVIIADSTLPRNMWPRGLIKAVHPGKDNRVRVVDVETVEGTFRRPSNKIICLPVKVDCVS